MIIFTQNALKYLLTIFTSRISPICRKNYSKIPNTISKHNGVKHLKHQILTLDVKIWCWTSIWRFLTSNINFWRPKSNIWRPTSIFDVLRQIWRQYLMSSINIWCWTSNIWCWTSNIWCWTSNIWCCTSNIWCQTSNIDKGRQILMPDVKNHQIDVQHQNLTPYVNIWHYRCFTPVWAITCSGVFFTK